MVNQNDPNSYRHMNVLREYITGDFGEEITNTDRGVQVDKKFTYSLNQINDVVPVMQDMKIVAYLSIDNKYSEIITATGVGAEESPVGLEEINEVGQVLVYPNPFYSNATIEFTLENPSDIIVEVMDLNGSTVYVIPSDTYPSGKNQLNINGSNLNPGAYYVSIIGKNELITKRVVLSK